jgi:phage FluMu gp28-like protein
VTKPTNKTLAPFFMPYQADFIRDEARMIIVEKGRQIGLSYAASYKAVRLAAPKDARLDVWVVSRDAIQAKQFLLYCKRWARVLQFASEDMGEQVLLTEGGKAVQVQVLKFANGLCIYCLSSNPDAIVGKSGHVIWDEAAIHKDQRDFYAIAKQVTQWGGKFIVISTHRGAQTQFNQFIVDIKERNNPMGWSLHTIPIQRAVADGIVEKINAATGGTETREEWLARQRRECVDEEQWLQEFCCIPADESTAFISYDMITGCEDDSAPKDFAYLETCRNPILIGYDVARTTHLSVIDVEEQVGDVYWERMRIELRNKSFAEQEAEFNKLMALPAVRRACIDATGLGMQLAERAVERWGFRAEAVRFSAQVKEDLAFPLRAAHEDRRLRYPKSDALRADLRGIKKETTASGNIRFVGESNDSHCDRFWSKALALHAGKNARSNYFMEVI